MRLAALAALAAGLACAGPRALPRASFRIGHPIELTARDLQGREVVVAAEAGVVRVVDFWATWCVPCREQLPALERLRRELGPRGLSVYAVSFDEDPAQIPRFLEATPVGFPVLWDRGGETWAARYQLQRLPTTLLVDRRGIIRFVHEGFDEAIAAEERLLVEKLIQEAP
ncbi:MAG TPA: TlpA disulfide reductase family protein [Anaeromyxobacteraceae bacterium]|nr:TlpA disulfide reductase family protein [Anaeromyxobacteraceae bacterium]